MMMIVNSTQEEGGPGKLVNTRQNDAGEDPDSMSYTRQNRALGLEPLTRQNGA